MSRTLIYKYVLFSYKWCDSEELFSDMYNEVYAI